MKRTSDSHPLRIASLPIKKGLIGITFCPGKQQKESISGCEWDRDIDTDIKIIKQWNASLVFGFPEDHEFESLKVANIKDKFNEFYIPFIHIPFIDDTTPDKNSENKIKSFFPIINTLLENGQNILFFCKGGLGRSGLVFAEVLINIGGIAPEDAINKLRAIRPGAICTQDQYDYVLNNKLFNLSC